MGNFFGDRCVAAQSQAEAVDQAAVSSIQCRQSFALAETGRATQVRIGSARSCSPVPESSQHCLTMITPGPQKVPFERHIHSTHHWRGGYFAEHTPRWYAHVLLRKKERK
jgi:hypothetical protein